MKNNVLLEREYLFKKCIILLKSTPLYFKVTTKKIKEVTL